MTKYSKNYILCGEIDYHCLICEETFKHEADVEKHIRWENHRKGLKNCSYFPKFKGDFIVKIGDYYFCEVCNIVISTAVKTSLHIKEQSHLQKKTSSEAPPVSTLVKRASESIIIFDNITLTEREWHGIIDSQCHICDGGDVENIDGHMKSPKHIIRLIQTRIEDKDGCKFYRKIGDDMFYCFTCKQPSGLADIDSHWTSKAHLDSAKKINYTMVVATGAASSGSFSNQFKNNMRKMFASPDKKSKPEKDVANNAGNKSKAEKDVAKNAGNKSKAEKDVANNAGNKSKAGKDVANIADKLEEFQNENIDVNFETNKAICKTCSFSPAFTVKAITEHIKMHKKAETNSPGFVQNEESGSDDDSWTTDDDASDDTDDSSDEKSSSKGDIDVDKENERDIDVEKENEIFNSHDHGKIRAELAKFGKPHFIKLIREGAKGYCSLCDIKISAHIKNFRQHVKGAKHIGHLELKGLKKAAEKKESSAEKPYKTKTLKRYLRNIFFVKHMDDFWINRDLCVDKHSFVGLCHLENNGKYDRIKCFVCNDVFSSDNDQKHCETEEHKNKLFATKVITSLKGEFVRELQPGLFHCGFCNEVAPSYALMKRHLKSFKHFERREAQEIVAGVTDDQYGMYMADTNTADSDIMWMQLMGHRLF